MVKHPLKIEPRSSLLALSAAWRTDCHSFSECRAFNSEIENNNNQLPSSSQRLGEASSNPRGGGGQVNQGESGRSLFNVISSGRTPAEEDQVEHQKTETVPSDIATQVSRQDKGFVFI